MPTNTISILSFLAKPISKNLKPLQKMPNSYYCEENTDYVMPEAEMGVCPLVAE